MKTDIEIYNEIVDVLYEFYEADHSMRSIAYIHPMFYNGTFSENNTFQPDKPEEKLTKEQFINELNSSNSRWDLPAQVLGHYINKSENYNNKQVVMIVVEAVMTAMGDEWIPHEDENFKDFLKEWDLLETFKKEYI